VYIQQFVATVDDVTAGDSAVFILSVNMKCGGVPVCYFKLYIKYIPIAEFSYVLCQRIIYNLTGTNCICKYIT